MRKIIFMLMLFVSFNAVASSETGSGYAGRQVITMAGTNATFDAKRFISPVRVTAIYVKYAVPVSTTFTVTAQLAGVSYLRSAVTASGSSAVVIIPDGLYLRGDQADKLLLGSTATNATITVDCAY